MKRGNSASLLSVSSLAVAALSLTVGCSQNKKTNLAEKQSAGVIVKVQSKGTDDLQKTFPANKVSLINKEEGLYKIQDLSVKDAKEKLPTAYVEDDKYINVIRPDFHADRESSLETIRGIRETIQNLNCKKGDGTIQPGIQLLSNNTFMGDNIVRKDSGALTLGATRGKASNGAGLEDLLGATAAPTTVAPKNVEFHWVVEAPAGSNTTKEADGSQFTVNPDRAGGFLIALIAQDPATKLCELTGVMLGVTWDAAYNGPRGQAGEYSATKFFHVPMVKADQAWSIAQGQGITIAIIDSGINYNHPDLAANIKINTSETPDNQIDDDGNGLVDDVYGWDFAMGDKYPYDDESHGTHVSGLAAAANFGIAKKAKILPIKAVSATGSATTSALVSAIYYAIQQKADIINLSLGGEGKISAIISAAFKKAQDAGILIVAAAGNGDNTGNGINTDIVQSHFTQADGANVVAVAATDENGQLTTYSNYGPTTVGIAAPGGTEETPIISTFAFDDVSTYIGYPGTSMATPIVTGAAAVVKSANPRLSYQEIKDILLSTSRPSSALSGKIGAGFLDVAAAAKEAKRRSGSLQLATQN